jgi:NAD(P)H-dependent FMN reductase
VKNIKLIGIKNMKLVAIVGSAISSGKTKSAIEIACQAVKFGFDGNIDIEIIDLSEKNVSILDGRKPHEYKDDTEEVVLSILSGDVFLVGTPVYRGTYTGALKNLLDHIPLTALENKPIGLVASGATTHHYLVIDHDLRGVLAWFNAYVLPGSVYLESSDFEENNVIDKNQQIRLKELGVALVHFYRRLNGLIAKPDCLTKEMWG